MIIRWIPRPTYLYVAVDSPGSRSHLSGASPSAFRKCQTSEYGKICSPLMSIAWASLQDPSTSLLHRVAVDGFWNLDAALDRPRSATVTSDLTRGHPQVTDR